MSFIANRSVRLIEFIFLSIIIKYSYPYGYSVNKVTDLERWIKALESLVVVIGKQSQYRISECQTMAYVFRYMYIYNELYLLI